MVVGGDGLWNCHIHTNDIGPAIEAAIEVGRPRQIRVSDLSEEVIEEQWVRNAAAEEISSGSVKAQGSSLCGRSSVASAWDRTNIP